MLAFIPSPPANGIHLGPLFVHAYGLMYVIGIALAVHITARRWAAAGGDRALVYDVALWAVPAGLIGARIYFDLTTPFDITPHAWWGPLAIWQGGLGVWGGIAAGTLAGVWRVRRAGASVGVFMNAAAPALLVAQAIGRVGNYFNQELFGKPSGAAVGAGDQPGGPGGRRDPGRGPEVRHLPAVVPLRDDLRPGPGRACSSGSAAAGGSGRRGCSPCTSPGTPPTGSSRRPSGPTPRPTSSGCG